MLFGIGGNHFAVHLYERTRDATEEVLLHTAFHISRLHHVLHNTVFQRVIGDDRQATALCEQFGGGQQHLTQGIHLVVHLDAQRLEEFRHVLLHATVVALAAAPQQRLSQLHELTGGLQRLLLAGFHHSGGNAAGGLQFPIEVEDVGQLLLPIGVQHRGGSRARPLVHSHVEGSLETEREATGGIVEVMTRHAQIGQQAVDVVNAVEAHPVLQIPEVRAHKRESAVVDDVPLGIGILVEAVEVSLFAQPAQDFARMAPTAERHVHIRAVGPDVQTVDALLQ